MRERGSGTLFAVGLMAIIVCAGVVAVDVAVALDGRMRAQTAADAAALAAAASPADPSTQAGRFAALNGAKLVECSCPAASLFSEGIARVVVEAPIRPLLLPFDRVTAEASAERRLVP